MISRAGDPISWGGPSRTSRCDSGKGDSRRLAQHRDGLRAAVAAAEDRVASTKSEVVAARARLRAEEATVDVSDANINAAKARASRSTAEKSFQKVVSPFAGVITERNVDQGTLVSSGSDNSKVPLYKLARIDTVKVYVDVPEYASSGVHVGLPDDVRHIGERNELGCVVRDVA